MKKIFTKFIFFLNSISKVEERKLKEAGTNPKNDSFTNQLEMIEFSTKDSMGSSTPMNSSTQYSKFNTTNSKISAKYY